jgi:hypothetical protein
VFDQVIAPSHEADWVRLSRTKSGTLFRKHILNKGPLIHPKTGAQIVVDDAFVARLRRNFDAKVCDIVQVPLANDQNQHSEDPLRNLGEVVGIEEEGDKVYALLDIRRSDAVSAMGKTILGASAMMHLDYKDTRTGKGVGPTLLHVCATNRPYVIGLEDYQEVVAATAEGTAETVLLTAATKEQSDMMTLDEMIAALKADHGIDLPDLQRRAEANDEIVTKLSGLLGEGSNLLALSNGEGVSSDEIIGAIAQIATDNVALTARLDEMETAAARSAAEVRVNELIGEGRILPSKRDASIELLLTNPVLFDSIVPEQPLVALSQEHGYTPLDPSPGDEIEAAIARYTDSATSAGLIRS